MPVKLDDLSVSDKLLEPNDYMCAYDLENMYFHVSIHPEHQKYLGFQIPNAITGDPNYYCFSVLIYGLAPAVWLFIKLTWPLNEHINKLGIRSSIMIDDGRTLGGTEAESWTNHTRVLDIFQQAGWNIQFKKTSTSPTQELYHQGFVTNTKNMSYSIPGFKFKIYRIE